MTGPLRTLISIVVALMTAALSGQVMTPGPIRDGSAAIQGRVFDAQSNEPLGDVEVRLTEFRTMRFRVVKTRADGAFEFAGVGDGEYTVTALSETHNRQCHGATDLFRMQCVTIAVVTDQRRSGIDFRLQRGGIVRGQVVDHEGRAVAGARVWAAGQIIMANSSVSKKDGTFELTNILGEKLMVAVDPLRPPDIPRSPTIYAPGVVDVREAAELDVPPGSVTTGISIVLPRVAVNTLTARVSSSALVTQEPIATLISTEPRMVRRIDLSADGVGAVRGLQDGRYFVSARARSADGMLAGFEVVDLAHDSYELLLPLQPAGRITGRIVAERGGLPPIDGVRVGAAWIYNGVEIDPLVPDQAQAAPDGAFTIDGLFGTRVLQLIGLSPEWQIHSVLRGRSDVTSAGVDVVPATTIQVTIVVARR